MKRRWSKRVTEDNHRLIRRSGIAVILTIFIAVFGLSWGGSFHKTEEATAAEHDTVDIRIIGTTDLHGQLNSKDYELGVDYNNGGLARVMDLITKTRSELPKENTYTLDAGDVLFDYTTEYIFSENQNEIQPIYKAMAMIGYDAITLGNHDFDYGYDYILRQLNGSGLRDVTVVSNVTDSKTGDYPFLESKLITRKLKTSSGKEVEVTVGIIGQTIPTLTAKTHSYTGILKTEDMVQNAKTEAAKLKEMGADVIIALSHTGIGPENPELNFKNVAYALTKIPEIDVVVCGHEHNLFPTTDMTSPYYKLPNVDKKTYLMNGKNVVMAGDRGEAIGVVNLTLDVSGDAVDIVNRSSEIRRVTADNTKENKTIATSYGAWEEKLSEYATEIIGELKKGEVIQNYYGLLGDNTAIQLLNDSKLQYALNYVNTVGKTYKNYPIIAASAYSSYGVNSVKDYINIHDQITESDLTSIQPYNNYVYLYSITGKQLKEWLEWSASAYETYLLGTTWTDPMMSSLMKSQGLKSLIREEWLNDWSNFYIFDGIDYVIDPSAGPRYDISGNKISNNNRIRSLKYNGIDVKDDMVFLLATDKITQPVGANQGVEKQVVLNGFNRGQSILSKYVDRSYHCGSIIPQVDYNWKVSFPTNTRFIIKIPNYADALFKSSPWYVSYLTEKDQYRYYSASFPVENGDKLGPNIILAPSVTNATATSFDVGVLATDFSEIKEMRYAYGEEDPKDTLWPIAKQITNNSFTVTENGTYTVFAEDVNGNRSVKKLVIDNFNENILAAPKVDTYTNRKTKISGTAEPKKTVVFDAYTGEYTTQTDAKGAFSYALPSQPSGSVIVVYIKDDAKGLESERVMVQVKRTGPNQPTLNPVNNTVNYINGDTNDEDAGVIAIIEDKVYVSEKGGKELFEKAAEIYKASYKIIPTYAEVEAGGYYQIVLPPQEAGKTVTVYNLDHLSRVSRANTTVVSGVAPNAPVVYEVSNIEKAISGYVPSPDGKIYDITMKLGDTILTTKTNKNGEFAFDNLGQLHAGQLMEVTAADYVNGSIRYSYKTPVTINDIESYVKPDSTNLVLNKVTSNSNLISGFYYDGGTVYLAISEGEGDSFSNTLYTLTTNEFYKFLYYLDKKLEPGMKIYVMSRFSNGRILRANRSDVIPGKPDMPSLMKDITNADKQVQVISDKDCELTLTIGTKVYTSAEYMKEESTNRYIYTFVTDRVISGTPVTVIASNVAGTSDILKAQIIKAAPDAPKVNPIKAGDKKITGTVELLDYTISIPEGSTQTAAPTPLPEQPKTGTEANTTASTEEAPKVAGTQTRIFAQIGTKTYEGTIDDQGNFIIKIPKQKAGTAIKLWGTNKAGRGPLIKVVVTK
jgi:2',3'-cyclic-nucleotide 2'-phosphodiesterase/3'-nucleotidase